jgi:hypothetical protein
VINFVFSCEGSYSRKSEKHGFYVATVDASEFYLRVCKQFLVIRLTCSLCKVEICFCSRQPIQTSKVVIKHVILTSQVALKQRPTYFSLRNLRSPPRFIYILGLELNTYLL